MAIKDGDKKPQVMSEPIVCEINVPPDGVKIGSRSTDKIACHGATPVVQRSGEVQAAITANSGATVSGTATATYTATEQAIINDLVTSINAHKTLIDAQKILINELRAALVEKGLIKGSA